MQYESAFSHFGVAAKAPRRCAGSPVQMPDAFPFEGPVAPRFLDIRIAQKASAL